LPLAPGFPQSVRAHILAALQLSFLLLLAGECKQGTETTQGTQTEAGIALGSLQHTSGDTSTGKRPRKTASLALRTYLLQLQY